MVAYPNPIAQTMKEGLAQRMSTRLGGDLALHLRDVTKCLHDRLGWSWIRVIDSAILSTTQI